MSEVLKASKEGINVLGSTDPQDLTYSSEYNTFKYAQSGTVNLVYTAGTPSVALGTVVHALGYPPAFFSYVKDPVVGTSNRWYPQPWSFEDFGAGVFISTYVTDNYLVNRFESRNQSIPGTLSFAYKIFKNQLF